MKIAGDELVGLAHVDDLPHSGQVADGGIIDVALVAQHPDGGPLAAGYGPGLQPHGLDRHLDGSNLLLGGVVMHDDEHGVGLL